MSPNDFILDNATFMFPAGSGDGATMNITVTVFNDSLLEGTESFGLSLSVRSGVATLAQGMENVTLYIMDEDGKHI